MPKMNPNVACGLNIEIPSIKEQQKIIDIIEPIEFMKNKILKTKERLLELIKVFSNFIIDDNGNKLNIIFQKEIKTKSGFYSQTADIGNFNNKIKKISFFENLPSRARIIFEKNTLYISKLLGEKKFLFRNHDKDLILSNGMWGIKSNNEFAFSNLSFFMSEIFYEHKSLFATGTTMVGLNEQSLNKIISKIKIKNDENFEKLMFVLFNSISVVSDIEDYLEKNITLLSSLLIK
ncbi:type I restriction enzyme, S subunit [Entomoplasma ellychniae]|uniref:Type I restriction enzyme, S subunit n=1 Tax=Entomoplasma ellychniae TaxID=2114 RepID=A0A8E2QWR8_9MOLU|nr:hypothetical protein [Entomoplasma ellychniae]PPE05106.1 type I restriction enzyme, S subunit [Entomoplasma ellychniae]